jgi:hypothetical protein
MRAIDGRRAIERRGKVRAHPRSRRHRLIVAQARERVVDADQFRIEDHIATRKVRVGVEGGRPCRALVGRQLVERLLQWKGAAAAPRLAAHKVVEVDPEAVVKHEAGALRPSRFGDHQRHDQNTRHLLHRLHVTSIDDSPA